MIKNKPYYSLNNFLREKHGEKVIKLSIDAGFTCPNRDGSLSSEGCVFCSEKGSGDFIPSHAGSITSQLHASIGILSKKWSNSHKYIAYFQSYSNTYAPLALLKARYEEALSFPDVVGIAIATRPDCLNDEIIDYLEELHHRTHLWIELGLQSANPATAKWINRGYSLECFEQAMYKLSSKKIETVVHLIIGFPYETLEDILSTIKYISSFSLQGIKLHMLHVLDNSPLGEIYLTQPFNLLSKTDYIFTIGEILKILPPTFVVHRLTGDGDADHLIAPLWTKNKKQLLNELNHYFKINDIYQGKYLNTY
ncbi:TIGR01212 family radical SAM protein [Cellulosilyticum sp. I15G10I2]|uniref:TIGR01212 family radical SAM protein n=1 Tax=Cellulosilyticum sp. I15G10I2 TaxID=1892843 RepID=UPI00085CAA7F|nr:TIGR01212 family radical SAM protein [Cellulosilyticum sp. I15G10I2]